MATYHIVLTKNGSIGELGDSLDCALSGLLVTVWVKDENGNHFAIKDYVVEHLESIEYD